MAYRTAPKDYRPRICSVCGAVGLSAKKSRKLIEKHHQTNFPLRGEKPDPELPRFVYCIFGTGPEQEECGRLIAPPVVND